MKLFATSVPVVVTLLAACGRPADAGRLATIDSLITVTDSLTLLVNAIDLTAYRRMDSMHRAETPTIEAQLADTTLDREVLVHMGNYHRAMDRSLGRVMKNTEKIRKELAYTRDQLGALRHDAAKGLLPEVPEQTYMEQERLAVRQLSNGVDVLVTSAATARREWDNYHVPPEP
ncbi:MAG: hypothetical protein JNM31_07230 [Flavobacteriales bacterium]|nr:hypothetical protein [Flavobacteriales bacterium]